MNGVKLIAAERQRQIKVKGYTDQEDEYNNDCDQLSMAAICYAAPENIYIRVQRRHEAERYAYIDPWPWGEEHDKRSKHDRLRRLVIAGALIAAEIDRLFCIMNPLFIPLKTEYYEAFKNGTKTDELRIYGPRWNHDTCKIGREAILSKGYGKVSRMKGHIWSFKKQHGSLFGSTYKAAIKEVFGTLDVEIACISISGLESI